MGGLTEGVYIMVVMFVLAVVVVISVTVLDIMQPIMNEELTEPANNATYQNFSSRMPSSLDSMFMIVFVLLWAGAAILAFFVDTHPIWFVLSIVGLVAVLMVAGVMANTYEDLHDTMLEGELTTATPMTTYVMEHLAHFLLAIVFTIFISLFAKSRL